MRILPALLLSGLFAGVAAAPAAPCRAGEVAGQSEDAGAAEGTGGSDHRGTRPDGEPESPGAPSRDEPRLAAAPGPAFKGPEERDRSGSAGDPPPAAHARECEPADSAPAASPCAAPGAPTGLQDRTDRLERRAGRRPLPPPALSGASRR